MTFGRPSEFFFFSDILGGELQTTRLSFETSFQFRYRLKQYRKRGSRLLSFSTQRNKVWFYQSPRDGVKRTALFSSIRKSRRPFLLETHHRQEKATSKKSSKIERGATVDSSPESSSLFFGSSRTSRLNLGRSLFLLQMRIFIVLKTCSDQTKTQVIQGHWSHLGEDSLQSRKGRSPKLTFFSIRLSLPSFLYSISDPVPSKFLGIRRNLVLSDLFAPISKSQQASPSARRRLVPKFRFNFSFDQSSFYPHCHHSSLRYSNRQSLIRKRASVKSE